MRSLLAGTLALTLALPAPLAAWPDTLMGTIARDARGLMPRSLQELLAEREREIMAAASSLPLEVTAALEADLLAGALRPQTLARFDGLAAQAAELLRQGRVDEGVVRLGALLRIPADLSDPVLAIGPRGYPPGVSGEYYAFVGAQLGKIPVVLDEPPALKLPRARLGEYWSGVLARSRAQSPLIGGELWKGGRLIGHRTLDYRSPVFGVASLSYSRAVTAIAATWLAVWRDARGDLTRIRPVTRVTPDSPLPIRGVDDGAR